MEGGDQPSSERQELGETAMLLVAAGSVTLALEPQEVGVVWAPFLPCAELLERVFLRVGSAESDEQLQQVLARFLTPTIAKLSSSHKSVQDKVTSDL